MKLGFCAALIACGFALWIAVPAEVAAKPKVYKNSNGETYTVRRRGGGYSYSYADSVNTYGDARSRYGGASVYRDPTLDRQTPSGPFDHGFFFDSAVLPRGGEAPYMH